MIIINEAAQSVQFAVTVADGIYLRNFEEGLLVEIYAEKWSCLIIHSASASATGLAWHGLLRRRYMMQRWHAI